MAVFALVGDSDGGTNKPFTATLPASALIETSPDNEHRWYFLRRAIGVGDAVELGEMMRDSCGGDRCSGVPTQPFRIAGTPNYPDKRKRARNRVTVPTRLVWTTERAFTFEQLKTHFADHLPEPWLAPLPQTTETRGRRIAAPGRRPSSQPIQVTIDRRSSCRRSDGRHHSGRAGNNRAPAPRRVRGEIS